MSDAPSQPPRDARSRLHHWITRQVRRFPELDLTNVDVRGLEGRDAAFARALEQVIIRRWLTLQAVAESRMNRPWDSLDPPVQAALLLGTAQIIFMDSVPTHAAINETVSRLRSDMHLGAAGLVNAVLRAVAQLVGETIPVGADDTDRRDTIPLADGRAVLLAESIFDEDDVRRLVQQTSHGEGLVLHWIAAHGFERTRFLCHHDLVASPISITGLDENANTNGATVPHQKPGFHIWCGANGALGPFLEAHPSARVQDPASAIPVAETADIPAALIVDFCAGRGTKTLQLAHAHPAARVLASDIDPVRQEALQEACIGTPTIVVVEHGAYEEAIGATDLLLLDVPCTNTGVLPRRPEAKYRFSSTSLKALAGLQRRILRETLPLLAPTGSIVFSTCSLEPGENERQVKVAASKYDLEIRSMHQEFPAGLPGDAPEGIHDGGFYAVLSR